jgi:hypothetical protein
MRKFGVSDMYVYRGWVKFAAHDVGGAISDYTKAADANPNSREA